jgi:hypothetical protein
MKYPRPEPVQGDAIDTDSKRASPRKLAFIQQVKQTLNLSGMNYPALPQISLSTFLWRLR